MDGEENSDSNWAGGGMKYSSRRMGVRGVRGYKIFCKEKKDALIATDPLFNTGRNRESIRLQNMLRDLT